jgi:formylglycine-generating enzyme required for sulfatase activity
VPSPWDDLVEVPGGEFAKGAKKERMEAFLKRLDLLNDHNTEVLTEEKWEEVDLRTLWIQRHPVTNAQYEAFANANPSHTKPAHWNAAAPFYPPEKADHPVVGVCHADAEAYATWVKMRLPTELEWEKAARGTDGRNYPWGDEFDVNRCNTWEAGHGDTVPVRQYDGKGDSPYGCCGMVGNVQEWTATTVEEEELKFAVVKGGSFDMSCQIFGLLHLRRKAPLDLRKEDIGFRCASDSPKRH